MILHRAARVSGTQLTSTVGRLVLALALAGLLLACGKSNNTFTPCVATPDCGGGRQCFELSTGAGVCLDTCPVGQALCEEAEACVPTTEVGTEWVCLPGGSVAINGLCARSVDCDLGGVCVTEAAFNVCRRACDPRVPICPAGTMCSAWTAERGYCAPIAVPADMGMSGG
jgi:hypothetical protein